MTEDREAGVGLHEKNDDGSFLTVNNTTDPNITDKYGDDSYYVSYGDKESGHITRLYDGEDNDIPEADQPKHSRS
jgi:hypothetical protein